MHWDRLNKYAAPPSACAPPLRARPGAGVPEGLPVNISIPRMLFAAGVGLLLTVPYAAAQTSLPTVTLASWEAAPNGSGVTFKPLRATEVSDDVPALTDETENGVFAYVVDTSDIKWRDACRCFIYYTVTVRSPNGAVSRHKFQAKPSGSFEDQQVTVIMTIASPANGPKVDEEVTLPVASAPGLEPAALVEVTTRERIAALSLGGASEVQVILRNPNKNIAIQVPTPIVVTPDDGTVWKQTPVLEGREFPLALGPGASETLRLRLEPDTWQAIERSFVPTSNDTPHTIVRLKVPYTNVLFQQRIGSADVELPLRFRPSIVTLGVALALGVMLGSIIVTLARKDNRARRYRAALTALGVAMVFELIGIFLVANNSKFVVLNFELDPWQTLPVLLLGIGNGLLGFEAAKRLKVITNEKEDS